MESEERKQVDLLSCGSILLITVLVVIVIGAIIYYVLWPIAEAGLVK